MERSLKRRRKRKELIQKKIIGIGKETRTTQGWGLGTVDKSLFTVGNKRNRLDGTRRGQTTDEAESINETKLNERK